MVKCTTWQFMEVTEVALMVSTFGGLTSSNTFDPFSYRTTLIFFSIHDVEVSNKDECVTVKNPSDHLLIENIFCNWSGGCAMGSLATDTGTHCRQIGYPIIANPD